MRSLYHGTIYEFDHIDVAAGKGYKDFGKGFYATAIPSHAERLAIRNKRIAEKRQGFLKNKTGIKIQPIHAYRYNLLFSEDTADISVKVFEKADKEWLRFIIQNRKCATCTHEYDIVIGPTADAETATIINDYYDELEESGYSDEVCEKVIADLKPENLPKQYFFRTQEAVKTLEFDKVKRQVLE
uniref:DUF3990 domain-containing protein n=1 Tax=Eubacterium cellulosolvens (strain ATCC 43171 / JCM 9499 / 6) TaxID=633697 RepID=I5AUX4_EUBC6